MIPSRQIVQVEAQSLKNTEWNKKTLVSLNASETHFFTSQLDTIVRTNIFSLQKKKKKETQGHNDMLKIP